MMEKAKRFRQRQMKRRRLAAQRSVGGGSGPYSTLDTETVDTSIVFSHGTDIVTNQLASGRYRR